MSNNWYTSQNATMVSIASIMNFGYLLAVVVYITNLAYNEVISSLLQVVINEHQCILKTYHNRGLL